MILYDPEHRLVLRDFGITVPIAPDRASRVVDALCSDPVLGAEPSQWLIQPDGSVITHEDLLRVHTAEYVAALEGDGLERAVMAAFELVDEEGNYHRYEPDTATRPLRDVYLHALRVVAGSYQCGRVALRHGFCFHCAGGMHHAHPAFGHGFCIINDAPISIRRLQAEGSIRTAWIIDVDAHKGDGTAAIMAGDDSVVTLSVHMAHGWPLDGPEYDSEGRRHPSYTESDIDVPVEEGEEGRYNQLLAVALDELGSGDDPDITYVLAGSDPYEKDELQSTATLNLTMEQMNTRDMMIYEFLASRNIPQAWLMAGGYGKSAWEPYPSILRHALRAAAQA